MLTCRPTATQWPVAAAYAIHRKSLTPTRAATALAVGAVPAVIGLYVVYR